MCHAHNFTRLPLAIDLHWTCATLFFLHTRPKRGHKFFESLPFLRFVEALKMFLLLLLLLRFIYLFNAMFCLDANCLTDIGLGASFDIYPAITPFLWSSHCLCPRDESCADFMRFSSGQPGKWQTATGKWQIANGRRSCSALGQRAAA